MPTDTPFVLLERHDHILKITLNRPEKKNALLPEMYDALRQALQSADADDGIHVVYITGSGDSFTAGNDLNTFLNHPESNAAADFIMTIATTQTPLVAAVNGMAVGVGVTMLLHCDLVYAAEAAAFNFAFIDLGIVPEAGASLLLPALVGQRRAAELLMLGGKFDAHTAQAAGIANDVLPADELQATAWRRAEQLAAKPPIALRQTKMLLKRPNADQLEETMALELRMIAERLQSDEARTIIAGILERRRS